MSTSNHQISVEKAAEMTRRYRENRPENFPICETFPSAVISALLLEPGCVSMRIYYGMDESKNVHAILVGVNELDEDILPLLPLGADNAKAEGGGTGGGGGTVLDDGFRCPTYCPPASKLNS